MLKKVSAELAGSLGAAAGLTQRVADLGKTAIPISPSDSIEKVTESLGARFFALLDPVLEDRKLRQSEDVDPKDVKAVIDGYANRNMLIAAAASAAPGPLGLLASAGELVLVTGNQLAMLTDVGGSFDKDDLLNRDLLLDIPLQAMGVPTDLVSRQGSSGAATESGAEQLQAKAQSYAKVIAVKNLKKSLVRCVPVGGALLMSVWTKKSTKKIGGVAEKFFDDAAVLEEVSDDSAFHEEEPLEILVERIKVLATMMEQNGEIKDEELAFLVPVIETAPIDDELREKLLNEAKRLGSHFEIDWRALREHGDVVDDVLSDLVVLARRDGAVGPNELAYLKHVANELGQPEGEVLDLLE